MKKRKSKYLSDEELALLNKGIVNGDMGDEDAEAYAKIVKEEIDSFNEKFQY